MSLQIKGKFISSGAIDGSKIVLKVGESIRALNAEGNEVELIKLGSSGEILANGSELAFKSALDAETSRAVAAEGVLQDNIDAEETARITADGVLQGNINAEAAARAAAISAEQTARANAIQVEKERAEAAEGVLQGNINAEQSARIAAVSAEATVRAAADNALDARLDIVEGGAGVVGSIAKAQADAQAYADAKVAALVNSAPAVLDTLKELSDAIGGDENFAATVAGQIGAVQAAVDAEKLRAEGVESGLSSAISSEESARIAAVSAEETRALAAEGLLASNLAAEVSARTSADSSLRADLNQEILDRAAAVSAEEQRALAAESGLQGAINALEISVNDNLLGAVDELEGALSAEESARISAVNTLTTNLANEISRAQSAESALNTAINTEKGRAQAAEGILTQNLAAEVTARTTADSTLQANINAEESARIAAVSAEATARSNADTALQTAIDAEAISRSEGDAATLVSAKNYTNEKVAALVASAPEVLDTLKELSDALGGDENFATTVAGQIGTVQANVDAEVSRAGAAEGVLQDNIDAEEARALAAEALKVDKAGDTITGEMVFDNADLKVKNPSGQVVAHFDASESSAVFGVVSADTLSTELVGGAIKVEAGVNLGGAQTFIGAGFINLQESDGSAAMPTMAKHAASKAYVDQEIGAIQTGSQATASSLSGRISILEAKAFYKVKRVLTGSDISNGYVNLDHVAVSNSIVASVGRLMIHQGSSEDFTVSVVGGVSRMTFLNSLVSPGEEALVVGDVIYVTYQA